MRCFHWCRSAGGHDWVHECKGDEQLDSYRLFCPTHGSESATQILSGTNDVLDKSGVKQGRAEGMEDNASEIPFPVFGDGYLEQSFAMACLKADEEAEDLYSLY